MPVLEGPPPARLLVYYGYPSLINGANYDAEKAAKVLACYGYVILGTGIEESTHDDHANTAAVIKRIAELAGDATKVFGYIALGKINNYSLDEFDRRAKLWNDMKVHGIFIDEFGYDLMDGADDKARRERQNGAVGTVHTLGLPVIANGWHPEQLFDTTDGPVSLGVDDYYFSESFQISPDPLDLKTTIVRTAEDWRRKAEKLRRYQQSYGFRVLSTTKTTTVKAANGADVVAFNPKWFNYAYCSALLDGHEAFGWGEPAFCATGPASDNAPFRVRPSLSPRYFTDVVRKVGPKEQETYERPSDIGTIWVKPSDQTMGTS